MTIFFSPATGGFYNSDIHSTRPADAVEISADDHAALMAGQAAGRQIVASTAGYPVLADPQPLPIGELAARAELQVRRQSGAARDAWRTRGKDGVYRRKLEEAAAWRAAGEPADLSPFPHLAAEVDITAATAGDLAALWDTMAAAWVEASARIEAVEQGALKAIREAAAANDRAAIDAAARDLVWPTPPA